LFFMNPSVTEVKLTEFLIPTFKASFNPDITSLLVSEGVDVESVGAKTDPATSSRTSQDERPKVNETPIANIILFMILFLRKINKILHN